MLELSHHSSSKKEHLWASRFEKNKTKQNWGEQKHKVHSQIKLVHVVVAMKLTHEEE